MLNDPDPARSQRAMAAMLQMKKFDIEKLKRTFAG
jgi:predicted 3-demethylubiquinone-9 3-methyltransferase (glyoxalase superfamily)